MTDDAPIALGSDNEDFIRVPGLFRAWELQRVIQPGSELHVQAAGDAADGTPLFAVYRREPSPRSP